MSRNQIRRTNQVGGGKLVGFLVLGSLFAALTIALLLLNVGNHHAANEMKELEVSRARLDVQVKSARLQAERLRSPKNLSEKSVQMNLGLVSVSQLEIVEAPARRNLQATHLAKEEAR